MNLEKDFLKKYKRITTMQPVPGKLGLARDGDFYWLCYSGMGQTNYLRLPDMEQKIAINLLDEEIFRHCKETQTLPFVEGDDLVGEIKFRIIVSS